MGGFHLKFTDDLTGAAVPDSSWTSFAVTPNIGFQKTLGKGFEALAGGSVNLIHVTRYLVRDNLNIDTKTVNATTDNGQFSLGLRWSIENFAVEAHLSATTLASGPYFISGGDSSPMFASLGVSLGFGGPDDLPARIR